ncbi:MAG: hypothetical protein ACPGTP_00435 [Bacteroidia bacterium]
MKVGKKPLNYIGGLFLEIFNLIIFPVLYLVVFNGELDLVPKVLQEPHSWYSFPIIAISIVSYFIIRYAYPFLKDSIQIALVIFLAAGILLNVAMIFDQQLIFSFFNTPIILLYIMQIFTHSERLSNTYY